MASAMFKVMGGGGGGASAMVKVMGEEVRGVSDVRGDKRGGEGRQQ